MSRIGQNILPKSSAYTYPYLREEDKFGRIGPVHPLHPLRRADTVNFSSISEIKSNLLVGFSLIDQNKIRDATIYAYGWPFASKDEVDFFVDYAQNNVLKLAATTTIQEDLLISEGVREAVINLMWRRVDAIESIIWWQILATWGAALTPPTPVNSFREMFALGRAFVSRFTPDMFFDAIMSSRAYSAMLLDNAAGSNQDNALTEMQLNAGTITPISIATNFLPYPDGGSYLSEYVVIMPTSLAAVCRRYVYEIVHDNRVVDNTQDKNIFRITCERYLSIIVPRDYFLNSGSIFIAPVAIFEASDVITKVCSKYGPGMIDNLNYISSIA